MKNRFVSPFVFCEYDDLLDLQKTFYVVVYHVGDSCRVAYKSYDRSSALDVMCDLSQIHPERQYHLISVQCLTHQIF